MTATTHENLHSPQLRQDGALEPRSTSPWLWLALIVAMLTGEGSFDHPATLSAFALGFVLFMVTLALNFIALRVVKRFREAYE